jgi:hypothetical protein
MFNKDQVNQASLKYFDGDELAAMYSQQNMR